MTAATILASIPSICSSCDANLRERGILEHRRRAMFHAVSQQHRADGARGRADHRVARHRAEEAARGRQVAGPGMREFKDSISGRSAAATTMTTPTSPHLYPSASSPAHLRQLLDEIVEHARAEAPKECCGMIARATVRRSLSTARATPPTAPAVPHGPDGAVPDQTAIDDQVWISARSITRTRARTRFRRRRT